MVQNSPDNAGDMGLTPGLGRPLREGNGNPLQYSCLGNSIDRGAWWATQSMGLQRVGHDLETKQQHTLGWDGKHISESIQVISKRPPLYHQPHSTLRRNFTSTGIHMKIQTSTS